MNKRLKVLVVTLSLACATTLTACGGKSDTPKSADVTTEESTTEEKVREVTPLTLGDMDKLLLDSAYINQMKQNGSTVTTTVGDNSYDIKLGINGAEYSCSFEYSDNTLIAKLSQDAGGYLAYMFSNYIANVVSDNFDNGIGYVDYLYSQAQKGTVAGDFEKYGFSISDEEVKISLNDVNFTELDLRDVALTEDDISDYLSSESAYIFNDKYSVSISNGFLTLTTDNNAADWYEINVVAIDNGILDTKSSVYDTLATVTGYYNNGDNSFFTKVVSKDMKSVTSDDLVFTINDGDKTLSVTTTSTLKDGQFTVYTLKFKRCIVKPVTSANDSDETTEETTEAPKTEESEKTEK